MTFLTKPEKDEVPFKLLSKVTPAAFWMEKKFLDRYPNERQVIGQLPKEIGLMMIGSAMVYAAYLLRIFSSMEICLEDLRRKRLASLIAV